MATLEPLLQAGASSLETEARRYLAEARLALGESAAAVALLQGLPQAVLGADPSLALLLGRAQYQAGNPEQAAATLAPLARGSRSRSPRRRRTTPWPPLWPWSTAAPWSPSRSGPTP